jgi:hypothetical protein
MFKKNSKLCFSWSFDYSNLFQTIEFYIHTARFSSRRNSIIKKGFLNIIKYIYAEEGNIIQHLKDSKNLKNNTDETIMISYDFQNGSYIKNVKENLKFNEKYL